MVVGLLASRSQAGRLGSKTAFLALPQRVFLEGGGVRATEPVRELSNKNNWRGHTYLLIHQG